MVEIVIWLATMTIAGLIWGLRLEGEVKTLRELKDQAQEALDKRLNERHEDIVARLERIERKQDAQNGNH